VNISEILEQAVYTQQIFRNKH